MDYSKMSREELIAALEDLSLLTDQLIRERQQEARLDYDWTGNLGHWYWNIRTNNVTFNPLKLTTLGYNVPAASEPLPYQFFTEKLHPDDYEPTMQAMRLHLQGKAHVYEAEYRIQAKDGSYHWFYDRGKITRYDEASRPLFMAGIVFDISNRKKNEELLEEQNRILADKSSTDSLTGLKNHRTCIEHLQTMIQNKRTARSPLSIAMMDLDDFKHINDSHGHLFGDTVLTTISEVIRNTIRESDLAGRYGGEEFLLVFDATPLPLAREICERIRAGIEAVPFENDVTVTISCGVCEYHGETPVELIAAADENLYEAKRLGKNRVV